MVTSPMVAANRMTSTTSRTIPKAMISLMTGLTTISMRSETGDMVVKAEMMTVEAAARAMMTAIAEERLREDRAEENQKVVVTMHQKEGRQWKVRRLSFQAFKASVWINEIWKRHFAQSGELSTL